LSFLPLEFLGPQREVVTIPLLPAIVYELDVLHASHLPFDVVMVL
jgi:hypothetical protein